MVSPESALSTADWIDWNSLGTWSVLALVVAQQTSRTVNMAGIRAGEIRESVIREEGRCRPCENGDGRLRNLGDMISLLGVSRL